MPRSLHLLEKSDLPGEIEIHSDLLSIMPSTLSRKRALKTGRAEQKQMEDRSGVKNCILCDPNLKPVGSSLQTVLIENRVAFFENDFPYLPGDQKVIYMWNDDQGFRNEYLHRYQLKDFGKRELYWLTLGCIELGKKYEVPINTYDLMRMVAGFNLGGLAGQSIPHFHMQYGWEVVLNRRSITEHELVLYFEELRYSDLILFEDDRVRVVAPWTPKGQFALELYFKNKHEILKMDDLDIKILAIFGEKIIHKYLSLGIQNLNIVFSNSPYGRRIEPLVVHFVPRVNMTALYEIRGVNVVDTPPQKIAEEFRRHGVNGDEAINWVELVSVAKDFDPNAAYDQEFDEFRSKESSEKHLDTSSDK
jgi:galactose-1-phosphate uridylyltransferase